MSSTGRTSWDVYAAPAFDIDQFDLNLFIDRQEFCNADPIYADLSAVKMGCESYEPRSNTPEIYATLDRGLGRQPRVMVCAKDVASKPTAIVYACRWRDSAQPTASVPTATPTERATTTPVAVKETPHDLCAHEARPEPYNTCYQYHAARLGFDVPDFSTPTPEPVQGGDATCVGGYCARIVDIGDWTCSQSKQGSGPWVTGHCARITDIDGWTCSQSKEGDSGRVTTGYCSRITQVNGRTCSQSRDGLNGVVKNEYCA